MNLARTALTTTATALLVLGLAGTADARPLDDPPGPAVTATGGSAESYRFAGWQGPRRFDGGPAYMIHTGISPL